MPLAIEPFRLPGTPLYSLSHCCRLITKPAVLVIPYQRVTAVSSCQSCVHACDSLTGPTVLILKRPCRQGNGGGAAQQPVGVVFCSWRKSLRQARSQGGAGHKCTHVYDLAMRVLDFPTVCAFLYVAYWLRSRTGTREGGRVESRPVGKNVDGWSSYAALSYVLIHG